MPEHASYAKALLFTDAENIFPTHNMVPAEVILIVGLVSVTFPALD